MLCVAAICVGWRLGLLRRVQPHQHRGAVRGGSTDPHHPVGTRSQGEAIRVRGPRDRSVAFVRHFYHHESGYVSFCWWWCSFELLFAGVILLLTGAGILRMGESTESSLHEVMAGGGRSLMQGHYPLEDDPLG